MRQEDGTYRPWLDCVDNLRLPFLIMIDSYMKTQLDIFRTNETRKSLLETARNFLGALTLLILNRE